MANPIVTVIIPTTHSRKPFNEAILNNFIRQDYPHKELLWDYSDDVIGVKRNRLCERAKGDIICHMDSDDIYANDWVSHSVKTLLDQECDIVGLHRFNLMDLETKQCWQYNYTHDNRPWVCGATMVYLKSFWKREPFPELKCGEDSIWMHGLQRKFKGVAHDYTEGFLASIHEGNTSKRVLGNSRYRKMSQQEEEEIRKRFFGA